MGKDLYDQLFKALDQAKQDEAWLESHINGLRHVNLSKEQLQKAALLTDKDLPHAMGKLISTLNLQSPFQSLGRYIRSFADAAFVVAALKDLIVERSTDNFAVINGVIVCCADYLGQMANLRLD